MLPPFYPTSPNDGKVSALTPHMYVVPQLQTEKCYQVAIPCRSRAASLPPTSPHDGKVFTLTPHMYLNCRPKSALATGRNRGAGGSGYSVVAETMQQ